MHRATRTNGRRAPGSPARRARLSHRGIRRASRRERRARCACDGSPARPRRRRRCEPSSNDRSAIASLEEGEKLSDLGKRVQLRLGTSPRLRQVQLGLEEESVCALELPPNFLGKSISLQSDHVQAVQLDRVTDGLHVWWNVFGNTRATANEAVATDRRELMHANLPGENRLLIDGDVSG